MADAITVIKRGLLQGDLDCGGHKLLNVDLTDLISEEFGLQDANTFFAGPTHAGDANPTFRAMVVADLPAAAMLTTENLAGLENVATSRTNLELTTTATATNTTTGLQLLAMAAPALEGTEFMISSDGVPDWVTGATVLSTIGAEPALGNPGTNGFVLSSTTLGVRSWIAQAASVLPVVDTTAVVKGSVDATKLLRFEVDGFTTGVTRVLTAPNFDGTIATLAGAEAFTNKTSYNGIQLVSNGGADKLALDGDITFDAPDGLTFHAPVASDITVPLEGTLATLDGEETLTNKTIVGGSFQGGVSLRSSAGLFFVNLLTDDTVTADLTLRLNGADRILYLGGNFAIDGALILSGAFDATFTLTGDSTLTLPESGTLATRENAEILANKTLEAVVGIGIKNGTTGFDLNIANTDESSAADRTLSIVLNNADRSINLSGDLTLAHSFITAGAFALTLTTTATTSLTLPTTGTVEAYVGVPASAAAVGIAGQKAYDASFEYRCIASGNWVRGAHATW